MFFFSVCFSLSFCGGFGCGFVACSFWMSGDDGDGVRVGSGDDGSVVT